MIELQDVSTASPNDTYSVIKDIIIFAIIPYCSWMIRQVSQVKSKVDMVNQTLVGQDGKNGIRSRVSDLEEEVKNLHLAFARSGIEARVIVKKDTGRDEL